MRSLGLLGSLVLILSGILSPVSISTAIPHFHRYRHGNRGRGIDHTIVGELLLPANVSNVCSAPIRSASAGIYLSMLNVTNYEKHSPKLTGLSKDKWQVHSSCSAPKDQHSSNHTLESYAVPSRHGSPCPTSARENELTKGKEIEKIPDVIHHSLSSTQETSHGNDVKLVGYSTSSKVISVTKSVQTILTESASSSSSTIGTQLSSLDGKLTSYSSLESPFEADQTSSLAKAKGSELLPSSAWDKDGLKAVSLAVQTSGDILTASTSSSKPNEVSTTSSSAQSLKVSISFSSYDYSVIDSPAPPGALAGVSPSTSSGSTKILVVTSKATSLSSITASSPKTSTSTTMAGSSDPLHLILATAPSIKYASSRSTPSVRGNKLQGSSSNEPSSQYVQWENPPNEELPSSLLVPGVDGTLTTGYGISPDTGVLKMNSSTKALVASLEGTPHMSRDGGKGGYLNGQKLFIFCDTGSYSGVTKDTEGSFLGFVSSSVAIDKGSNAKFGNPIVLEDGIAQWGDNNGRMRGFSPLTVGEQSYNLVMQGAGHRYAVWPESSLISLNATMAIMYAPIIYLNVDMTTKGYAYTYTGSTLLTVTVQAQGGPRAVRLVEKLFDQDEVEWGTIGGIRSWGPSGVGGNDGMVYVLGCISKIGLLVGRVEVDKISDKSSYQYWNGETWSLAMPTTQGVSTFITGAFMDGDMFYSPYHLTFIFVYLTPYADSTFYFRFLEADIDILPPTTSDGQQAGDYVENIVKYKWSDQQVLYKASPGPTGKYAYAGGVQAGYFDEDDITNGGTKMLISWTVPTGADPSSEDSEYFLVTAEIDWA